MLGAVYLQQASGLIVRVTPQILLTALSEYVCWYGALIISLQVGGTNKAASTLHQRWKELLVVCWKVAP
jgi:hypothetical protein